MSAHLRLFGMSNFHDIEMLEIPEDLDTESIASVDRPARTYVELKDWIHDPAELAFQFDASEYHRLVGQRLPYHEYVTRLYKVVEALEVPDVVDEEPMGLITDAPDIGRNSANELRKRRLSDAFAQIVEALEKYIAEVEDSVDGSRREQLHGLLSVLDCAYGTHFASTSAKPELLAKWVNRYDHKPADSLVEQVMIHTPRPYRHAEFWLVYLPQLLVRGLVAEATDALESSKYEELPEDNALRVLIDDFVVLVSNYQGLALKGQFASWKLSACEFRDSFSEQKARISDADDKRIAAQLYDLTCVVTGMPKSIARHATSWYEVYVALSLYHIRDVDDVFDDYYEIATKEVPPPVVSGHDVYIKVEKAFVDIMEQNCLKVLETMSAFDDATAAFTSRLFELNGLFSSYYVSLFKSQLPDLVYGRTVSEYLLTKYAYESLHTHALVPVAIGLLMDPDVSSTGVEQRHQVVAEFLPQYECVTNDDLEWALTICAKLNLPSTAKQLYLKHGRKSLRDGYIYEALNMLVQCYDTESPESAEALQEVHHIVWDVIFQDALVHGRPVEDDLINNIVYHKVDRSFDIHPVIRQCLAPYAVLAEFFRAVAGDASVKNVSKLIHLIRFNHLPKKFVPLLLAQILPFFHNNSKFHLPDLIIITEAIDNYENQVTKDERAEGNELYLLSVEHNANLPPTGADLIKTLRNEIVARIGRVFIEQGSRPQTV